MRDANTIMRERQFAVRREMDRRGIALKAVQFDAGLSYSTLISYFPAPGGEREPAVIPMSAVFQIMQGKALPLDLVSLLLPAGFALVAVPDCIDHDSASEAMHEFLALKGRAHRHDSPAGPAIAPCEDQELRAALAAVKSA